MNKAFWQATLLFLYLNASAVYADEVCGPASRYRVDHKSFSNLAMRDALSALVSGTPFRIDDRDSEKGDLVSATDVNGPVDEVIKKVAGNAGLTVEQSGCRLIIRKKLDGAEVPVTKQVTPAAGAASPAPTVWLITKSDGTVRNALGRWAEKAGWQAPSWEMPEGVDFHIDETASFSGTFESAVQQLAASLSTSQMPIKVLFYMGNHVLRIVPAEEAEK